MFVEAGEVNSWKEDLKDYNNKRKNVQWDNLENPKFVTWKEVKQKDVEYNPILQKFSANEKENDFHTKERESWVVKNKKKQEKTEKYLQDFDIINLAKKTEKDILPDAVKTRVVPSAQVDFNIITNEKHDENYWKNTKRFASRQKKVQQPQVKERSRQYDIVSNTYYQKEKEAEDVKNNYEQIKIKFDKTHDYNFISGEFFDPNREKNYKEQRETNQKTHHLKADLNLPPTAKAREPLVFDYSKEISEATKALALKEKLSKKRFELKYKFDEEIKLRNLEGDLKHEHDVLNRINPKKNYENHFNGFKEMEHVHYVNTDKTGHIKEQNVHDLPVWERLMMTANPRAATAVAGSRQKLITEEKLEVPEVQLPAVRAQTAKVISREPSSIFSPSHKDSPRGSMNALDNQSEIKSLQKLTGAMAEPKLRGYAPVKLVIRKENAYNPADKYNAYAKQPGEFLKNDVDKVRPASSTVAKPQSFDSIPKFALITSGGFKKKINTLL